MTEKLLVRRAAVLGAGVMGAQIAAHLVNAGVDTVLFDLPAKEGDPSGVARKAVAGLGKLSPAPLADRTLAARITPANYDSDLELLGGCDLVIEAIAERMDWKQDLYRKVGPHIAPHAVLASNTSGLGINKLADVLPEELRSRFCGVHFFNPPRYMHLAELIPAKDTGKAVLEGLETFLTTHLGKGVVYARDTPNFIGNRIGVFSILATAHHTAEFNLGFDEVDAITGPLIGRPKSATYRTSDVVGLDTMAHVIKTMADTLPDDPWHRYFKSPAWLSALVEQGALGQKTRAGVFRKVGKDIMVLDVEKQDYRPADRKAADEVVEILKMKDPAAKFAKLRESDHPQARFLWAVFRDLFHYSAFHLADIAQTARDVDLAIRWGYGWSLGPFETWQAAGWKQVAQWIDEDIKAGKAMSDAPLPGWVLDGREGVHGKDGSYSPDSGTQVPRSTLPVYERQRFPDPLLGERFDQGQTLFENDGVRLWTDGDGVGVISFKTKMHTVSDQVLDGIQEAIGIAERDLRAVVIWQPKEPFSAGADLAGALGLLQDGKVDAFEAMVANFQRTSQRIKYSLVPVVAAVRGLALGGGCEFQMHSARTVAHLESYIGLVEAGVFRDLFHYSAFHLADIAETARDVDLAIRWGYGWSLGPFETWQAAGWKQVAQWIDEDIKAGKSMSDAPLPAWVLDGREGVHGADGSYSPDSGKQVPRSALPVYERQRFPDPLLGERFDQGETLFENDGIRLWTDGDGVGVISFKTKMHTVSDQVLDGIQEAIGIAERDLRAVVIWQPKEPFSAGADLAGALGLLQAGKVDAFEDMVANFQRTSQRIKYALVPVVAAVRGLALGGGCEFQMHSARTVAHLESYIGLVEAGVGLLPAGGGLKELAVRAAQAAGPGGDVLAELKRGFETVAMAKVSKSAMEAKSLGLLRPDDVVVFHAHELLHVARQQALALAEAGYRPPLPARAVEVAGDVGIATLKMMLVNMLEGRFISPHDNEISERIADVLCGGEVDRGAQVDEDWLLRLEREHFVALAQMPKSQERIAHMLKTGKPLRN